MQLVLIGVNHKTAPLEVREKLAFTEEQIRTVLKALDSQTEGAVILSTCNRTEIYVVLDEGSSVEPLKAFWGDFHSLPLEYFNRYLYTYYEKEAVQHLFKVAAGVDSMIVGEDQILGQVRDAYSTALEIGALPSLLSALFHHALRVGRLARKETNIGRHAVSVSSAGVELARRVFGGELDSCRVLVISAGEAGKLTAKSLKSYGVKEIGVTNRTYQRAVVLAEELGGQAIPFERLSSSLKSYEIVISATGSPDLVLSADQIRDSMQRRGSHSLVLIDLAVPRDIDPEARKIPNVHLYDIDDLHSVAKENLKAREQEVGAVEKIVEAGVEKFLQWWTSRRVVSLVTELEEKAESIRLAELNKTVKRLPALSAEELERVDILTRAIVRKLLHSPITTLKDRGERDGYAEATRQLFNLKGRKSPVS